MFAQLIKALRRKEERYRPVWMRPGDTLTYTFEPEVVVDQELETTLRDVTGQDPFAVLQDMFDRGAREVLQEYMPEGGRAIVGTRFFVERQDSAE